MFKTYLNFLMLGKWSLFRIILLFGARANVSSLIIMNNAMVGVG